MITLKEEVDFEATSSYSLTIVATDLSHDAPLSASANVAINIKDVQDQPPIFLNAPYSATLQENTSPVRKLYILSLFPFRREDLL